MGFLQEQVGDKWYNFLKDILPEFSKDWKKIVAEYKKAKCYPEKDNIFRAFKEVDLEDVKVVLIGQDPYHDGVATGLI